MSQWIALIELSLVREPHGAPCSKVPERWWAESPSAAGEADRAYAVAACEACLVLEECRSYALAVPERHGVWGGLTAAERGRLLARERAA